MLSPRFAASFVGGSARYVLGYIIIGPMRLRYLGAYYPKELSIPSTVANTPNNVHRRAPAH